MDAMAPNLARSVELNVSVFIASGNLIYVGGHFHLPPVPFTDCIVLPALRPMLAYMYGSPYDRNWRAESALGSRELSEQWIF